MKKREYTLPKTLHKKNKSGKAGVTPQKIGDLEKWDCRINCDGKSYFLGYYEKVEDAIAIRNTAEEKVKTGTFLDWYSKQYLSKSPNQGVYYEKNEKLWCATIGHNKKTYWLGCYKKEEDALAARKMAVAKRNEGTLETWHEEFAIARAEKKRQTRENPSGIKGVSYRPKRNDWMASTVFNGRSYYLGVANTVEGARKIVELAHAKKEDGTFSVWLEDWKKERKSKNAKETG